MFTSDERAEIRALAYTEFLRIHRVVIRAGSYRYICHVNGQPRPVFSHKPIGDVLLDTEFLKR